MFVMFDMYDMYVKLPPDASPIAVNKFYLLTYTESSRHEAPILFCVMEVLGTEIGPEFAAVRILCCPTVNRCKTVYNI